MGVVAKLCENVELPKMVTVSQRFDRPRIAPEDIPAYIVQRLSDAKFAGVIRPGMRVAITVGSRGIANIALITRALADFVKARGGEPFIVPAMGSHGGATAEGQRQVIESYGVTEESMGCPIISSMETVYIGDTEDGHPVRMDKNAYEADGIIVAGRVKPHTAFRGPFESGLMKMMTIGLGKQEGAELCHQEGFGEMAKLVPMFAKLMMQRSNVVLGFAIVENAYDETAMLEPMLPEEIEQKEPPLLLRAKELMPSIQFAETDILIVDVIGKNFSGDGHDPNITGRFLTPYADGGIKSQRMVILDLSEESHGNGCGVGLADITTRRFYDKMDFEATYPNVITSTVLHAANVPLILDCDANAIKLAVRSCNGIDRRNVRIIRIPNSLHIGRIQISEALLPEAEANPNLTIEGEPAPFAFDENGNLF